MIRLFTSVNIFKNVIIHVYKTILQFSTLFFCVLCVVSLFLGFFFTIQNVMIFSSRLTVNLTECLILIDDVRIGAMFTDGTDGI